MGIPILTEGKMARPIQSADLPAGPTILALRQWEKRQSSVPESAAQTGKHTRIASLVFLF
jgi:hypothetical protein